MSTQVMTAASLGAANFMGVRVTDGTDVQAEVDINDTTPAAAMKLLAKYTGTVGNSIRAEVSQGTNSTLTALTYKITIYQVTGTGSGVPEIYDNIGGTGLTLWQNFVNAINLGQGGLTAPSQLVVASLGAATGVPDLDSYSLSGGLDGNSGVTETMIIGSDTLPLTGMYAATETDFSLMVLCGVTGDTTYVAQAAFAANQGAEAILARPLGESYAAAITSKKSIGLVSYATKLMVGEAWIKTNDTFNKVQRYVTPQGYIAGLYSTLQPQESGLNKVISSSIFLSTWYADQNKRYTNADIIIMLQNGVDALRKPSPGGFYWSLATGKNTSDNQLASGDQFTRLTNFLAASIQSAMGVYIGQLQNEDQRRSAKTKLDSFLNDLATQNVIGSTNGGQAFTVVINDTNNPISQVALGIEAVSVTVAFFQVIVAILVNLETGVATITSIQPQ
jgi:hypothetical protein